MKLAITTVENAFLIWLPNGNQPCAILCVQILFSNGKKCHIKLADSINNFLLIPFITEHWDALLNSVKNAIFGIANDDIPHLECPSQFYLIQEDPHSQFPDEVKIVKILLRKNIIELIQPTIDSSQVNIGETASGTGQPMPPPKNKCHPLIKLLKENDDKLQQCLDRLEKAKIFCQATGEPTQEDNDNSSS